MGISFDEALSQLSAIHDEAALRALIEQLDVTGNTSRVTVLWAGTQDGKVSVGKGLVPGGRACV